MKGWIRIDNLNGDVLGFYTRTDEAPRLFKYTVGFDEGGEIVSHAISAAEARQSVWNLFSPGDER